MGLKCVAIYRDGSKRSQPLNTKRTSEGGEKSRRREYLHPRSARIKELEAEVAKYAAQAGKPLRRRLSDTRTAITHKFDIAGHEGYLTVGLFETGQPGELFITMAKEGSTIGGLMDGIGTLTSLALQYGVPLEALVRKFAHVRFEPSGFTKNPDIRNAASITDYVFRWMAVQFIPGFREANSPNRNQPELAIPGSAGRGKEEGESPRAGLGYRGGHGRSGRQTRPRWQRQGPPPRQARPRRANGQDPQRFGRPLSTGRPHLPELRPRHRPQRRLLQVPQLRRKPGLLIARACAVLLWSRRGRPSPL